MTGRASTGPAITLHDVWHVAGSRVLLRAVTAEVGRGELVAIAGPSGSGKSTLLAVMAGLTRPDRGTVQRLDTTAVGFVPQEDLIHPGLRLRTTLRYAARLRLDAPRAAIDQIVDDRMRLLNLHEHGDVRVGDLSGGQRKRASIAVELLRRPAICFLDEPTSGLDPVNTVAVTRSLRTLTRSGVTVVTTTHDPTQIDDADRVLFLANGGRLAFDGTPDAARTAFGVARLSDAYAELVDHAA